MKKENLKIGSIVEMRNAYQSFYYKVLDLFDDRAKVLTEDGVRYYCYEDFYSMSDSFDFSKVVVTKDNIHLYYEFMGDKDLKDIKNKYIISDSLCTRFYSICEIIFKNEKPENINKYVFDVMNGDLQKEQFIFGIKDTLKPIDEYIAEIKESSKYIEYIKSKFDFHYDSDEDVTEIYQNDKFLFDVDGCLDYDEALASYINYI